MQTLTHWNDLLNFLKNPSYKHKEVAIKNKLLLTLNSFILNSITEILLIVVVVISYLIFSNIENIENLSNMSQSVRAIYPPIILAGLVAILEEFSFRGFLDKFNPIYFSISITGILAYFIKKIVFTNMFLDPDGLLIISLSAIPLFLILLFISSKYKFELNIFWGNNFKYIFYVSALLFALVHFFNSPTLELSYLKTNVLQFIFALVIGFVRIRSGLIFAILYHFVWNSIVYSIS